MKAAKIQMTVLYNGEWTDRAKSIQQQWDELLTDMFAASEDEDGEPFVHSVQVTSAEEEEIPMTLDIEDGEYVIVHEWDKTNNKCICGWIPDLSLSLHWEQQWAEHKTSGGEHV